MPESLGAVGIDGQQRPSQVMRADHTKRTFNQLAVTRFALAQRGLSGALRSHIDAGGDDKGDLTLRIGERSGRPGDTAQAAVAIQPLILKCRRKMSGAQALEGIDRLGDILPRDELVPRIAANERGEVITRGGLARAVEAND